MKAILIALACILLLAAESSSGGNIGRRPISAAGNTNEDCDHESHIGTLDKALGELPKHGWVVVDMNHDWKAVFPPDK